MISLNLSPETKIGTITNKTEEDVTFKTVDGKCHTLSMAKFCKLVTDQELSISRAKVLCSQKKKGIFPSIVDKFYADRVKIKRVLNKLRRELSDMDEDDPRREEVQDKADKLKTKQFTIKILINRIYGYSMGG